MPSYSMVLRCVVFLNVDLISDKQASVVSGDETIHAGKLMYGLVTARCVLDGLPYSRLNCFTCSKNRTRKWDEVTLLAYVCRAARYLIVAVEGLAGPFDTGIACRRLVFSVPRSWSPASSSTDRCTHRLAEHMGMPIPATGRKAAVSTWRQLPSSRHNWD